MSPFPGGHQETRYPYGFGRSRWRNADLRVSDADRAEVTDLLSKHYSDGRLDEATFNERLDQTMRATTESDLAALLADLPPLGAPAAVPPPQGRPQGWPQYPAPRRRDHRILFLVLIIVLAVMAGPILARMLLFTGLLSVPMLLIGLIAFVWLSHRRRHSHL
jgi:hypothetical protein